MMMQWQDFEEHGKHVKIMESKSKL